MLRNLLLAVLLVFGTASLSFSQISCPGPLTVEIEGSTEGTPLEISGVPTQPDCNALSGDLTGSIVITVTGGSPAYTYDWTMDGSVFSPGDDTNLTGLGSGTYAVTVTDQQDCTVEGEWIITEPTPVAVTGDPVNLDCNSASGDANGSITITPSGGTVAGDYDYNWASSTGGIGLDPTAQNQTGLTAGTYQVTVTDDLGCTATDEYILTEPDAIAAIATAVGPQCHADSGAPDGSITLIVQGGDGNYTYNWETTDGSGLVTADQNQTGLSAGTYDVTITDGLGCILEAQYTITEPTPVAIDATPVDLDCHSDSGAANGSISIVASGGQGSAEGDYTYTWSTTDGTGLTAGVANQTGLSAGTYSLTVTDANGCTDEGQWTLTQPEAVVADGTPVNLDCNSASGAANGSITMAPTGGDGNYSYTWSTADGSGLTAGAGSQTGLSAGTYDVTVTDGLGCEDTNSFTLTEPDAVVADGTPVNLDCNSASGAANGSITMAPTGGDGNYSYTWSTADGSGLTAGAGSQTGLSAGTYDVTVTDGLGCEDTNSFTLTEPDAVVADGTPVNLDCNSASGAANGSITMAPTGGDGNYSYTWSTADGSGLTAGAGSQTGLSAGTYDVTVTDGLGCEDTNSFTLTEPDAVVADGTPVNLDCNSASGAANGSITMAPTGGDGNYSYTWSTADGSGLTAGAGSQTGLSAGTYDVTVTDGLGCEDTNSFTLTEPDAVVADGTPVNLDCNSASGAANGSITMAPTGGDGNYSYTWSTADGSGLTAGAGSQTGLSAGTYDVTVTDGLGCEDSNSFTLTEPDAVVADGTPVNLDCNSASGAANGSITMAPTGGDGNYSYTWSTADGSGLTAGAGTQTGLSAGTYDVTVTDGLGCEDTNSFTLTEPDAVVANGTPVNLDCNSASGAANGSITMAPTGGDGNYSYTWSTADGSGLTAGAGSQTGLSAGTYDVTVTDGLGCEDTNSFTLTEPDAVVADGTPVNLDCNSASGAANGSITMTPTGGDGNYSYTWSTADGSGLTAGAGSQTGLSAGTYDVTVTDGLGCEDTNSFTLTEPDAVVADGTPVQPGCNAASGTADGSITMAPSGGDGNYSYTWDTADGSTLTPGAATQTGLGAGTYNVTVTDGLGCEATNTFTLTEPDAVSCTLDSPQLGADTTVECYGDEAVITVTGEGGTGAYTYILTGTDYEGNAVSVGPQASNEFTVPAGNYTVETIDANGCSSTCDIEITHPDELIAGTCSTDDDCQVGLGEIEVEAQGGYGELTVTWTSTNGGTLDQGSQVIPAGGGSVIFTGADGGSTYIFTITDENGCILGG